MLHFKLDLASGLYSFFIKPIHLVFLTLLFLWLGFNRSCILLIQWGGESFVLTDSYRLVPHEARKGTHGR